MQACFPQRFLLDADRNIIDTGIGPFAYDTFPSRVCSTDSRTSPEGFPERQAQRILGFAGKSSTASCRRERGRFTSNSPFCFREKIGSALRDLHMLPECQFPRNG